MYIVSGMSTRRQFETLEEAVLFRDGNPAVQIFEEDAYGNVKKILDRDINKTSMDIMAQKKSMESQQQPKEIPKFMQEPAKPVEKASTTFKVLLIVFMILILLYVAYRMVGKDVVSLFRNIGGLVVMLA